MISNHAIKRIQQRSIPPIIEQWLDEFGENKHEGHGGIKRYFSHKSIKRMKKNFGSRFVQHNNKWFNVYKIDSTTDGSTITIGWRAKKIRK